MASMQYVHVGMRLVLSLYFLLPLSGYCQMIDNAASYRNISSSHYFRLHYENDYFSETDEYYTQGINLEFVHPKIGRFPLKKFLLRLPHAEVKSGVSLEHLGYTPTSISSNEILYGDRPFAATLFLKTFSISNDSIRHQRLVSALSTGIIGPAAGGKEMQQKIHQWIGDIQPLGWEHQIQNSVLLNYQLDWEKQVLAIPSAFLLSAKTGGMLGSLLTRGYVGLVCMAGYFDSPFTSFSKAGKKVQIYVYAEPKLNFVGYDATLQGGVFQRNNEYTIASSSIQRLVYQHNLGLVVKVKRVYLEYFQSLLSQEFATQDVHHWGGIRLGCEW